MITLDDLTKVYPGTVPVHALDGIDLEIPAGQIHGIVGQSGAGKSTLIRCLTALERPTSGSVVLDGQELSALSPRKLRTARRAIGMVFQGANLLDARTAAQNIAFPLSIAKTEGRRERVEELLELVGLAGRGGSYPSQLSGGQRQRVAIARALAAHPKVLLCDEPTSALDTRTTDAILDLIVKVRDETGVTVLIITHEMDVVRSACDAVTLLEAGRVVQSGPVSSIVSQPDTRLGASLVPPPQVAEAEPGMRHIDVAFTALPGEPAGSRVMSMAARMGADVAAGRFEALRDIQVARLVLAVPEDLAGQAVKRLRAEGVSAKERAA